MSTNAPTHRVYTLIPRKDDAGEEEHFWLNIGSAFVHKDGKGFNVVLEALPIHNGGQLVLREVKEPAPAPTKARRR